jgi:uncharacterized phage protein (TIGR02218 family)
MPLDIVPALATQIARSSNQYWALCWRITLTQIANRVYRFTDASEPLTFPDGEVFQAMDGMSGSAQQRKDSLKGINRDLRGLISDSSVTDEDLNRGIFLDAYITEYLVDTRLAGIGPINVTQYWIRAMEFDGSVWNVEVDGTTSQFDQPVGDYWGKACRVEVFSQGSGKCNLSEALFRNSVLVSLVVNDRSEFEANSVHGLWNTNFYGNDGFCTFVNGLNAGFVARIKLTLGTLGVIRITLAQRTPYPIAVADLIELLPGCNKRSGVTGHCGSAKFFNIFNFQGEPLIPGGDAASKGAALK